MDELMALFKKKKSICWYPSAGGDFRALLYLSDAFYNHFSKSACFTENYPEQYKVYPDLFVLSDYYPRFPQSYYTIGNTAFERPYYSDIECLNDKWQDLKILFSEYKTRMLVKSIERYSNVIGDCDDEFISFEKSPNYGSAFLIKVSVVSRWECVENSWDVEVLYIIGENTLITRDLFLKNNISVDTLIQIRYGESFGGSKLSGNWIKRVLNGLQTNLWIANEKYVYDSTDSDVESNIQFFKDFPLNNVPKFKKIYSIDGKKWSDYDPVLWNIIER